MNTTEYLDTVDKDILKLLFFEYRAFCIDKRLDIGNRDSWRLFLEKEVMTVEILLRKLFTNRIETADFGEKD